MLYVEHTQVMILTFVFAVVMTKQHLIYSYNECRLSVVHLTRPPPEGYVLERLSTMDPKIHTCEVAGPSGRRFERMLSANLSGDMVSNLKIVIASLVAQNSYCKTMYSTVQYSDLKTMKVMLF